MFDKLVLHGLAASLVWGYRPAAVLTSWRIARSTTGWTLTAIAGRVDRFQCSQAITRRELRFAAVRVGGYWSWPVTAIEIAGLQLTATLGPPEQ